jgi:endoglucanase
MTFDIYRSRSEAIHITLVGYAPEATIKAADLYYWMGSGGARNYSSFQGNNIYIYNVNTQASTQAGVVDFWMDGGTDVGWYNLIRSGVWRADFSNFFHSGDLPAGC